MKIRWLILVPAMMCVLAFSGCRQAEELPTPQGVEEISEPSVADE